MSNERVTTVTLLVNGRKAEETLAGLTKRAEKLREAIDAAQKSGDEKNVNVLTRELEAVNERIMIIERNIRSVSQHLTI